jgi:LuxR family transcriptional regulator, maltose regulon positive regulatory protein
VQALVGKIGLERLAELEVALVRERAVPPRLVEAIVRSENETLTPAEREVLVLVASGMTNAEIAAERGVSLDTVKKQLRHAYARLGVHRRIDAVNAFIDHAA